MDERQWWFASKLQDSFRFSGYDNPSLLEDFLSDYDVSELITKFLGPGGPKKLFFYCELINTDDIRTPSLSNRQLQVTSEPSKINILSKAVDSVCLYCLRRGLVSEVDVSQIDSEVYCGEIRHSALVSLSILLSEAYVPLLHAQSNWGKCSPEERSGFLQTFDRLTSNIHDNAALLVANEKKLTQPSARLKELLSMLQGAQHPGGRGLFSNDVILEQCEELVGDWIAFIEGALLDSTEDRMEDPFGFPYAEKQKLERRQILLHSIVEQLKRKESTVVIATLAAGKSRLLKKWRTIDTQLTEAFNASKDRVYYLTALQPQFDKIQSASSVSIIITEALPVLFHSIKQMDGLSRLYATTGYIALLLKRVANLVTATCQKLIETHTTSVEEGSMLWTLISDITASDSAHQLPSTLSDIIKLSSTYRSLVYSIKDTLLHQTAPFSKGQHRLKHSMKQSKVTIKPSTSVSSQPTSTESITSSVSPKQLQQPSITLNDVDAIMESLFELANRASKLLSVITMLKKLGTVQPLLVGLPRASKGALAKTTEKENEVSNEVSDDGTINPDEDELSTSDIQEGSGVSIEDDEGLTYSVAECVSDCVTSCIECLIKGCPHGSREVFAVVGKEKAVFPLVYLEYSRLIEEFEEAISDYLMVVFPRVKESSRGLDILKRLSLITDGNKALSQAVTHCSILMFRIYGKELEHVKQHYEENKGSPPILRGQSKIGGSIEWARNLLMRVQTPMDTFRHSDAVMKTPESHHICTLHNKLSTVLLQYEAVWLKQYKEMMEKTSSRWMSAPLLRLQEMEGEKMTKILVNSDTGLLQVMNETKSIMRLGAPLSHSAKTLLSQETRVKSFECRLQYVVGELYDAVDRIDCKLKPLFEKLIEGVMRFFLPGWTTLTWSTLNIDAFLHQVDTAVDLLKETVDRSNKTISTRVYPVFDTIASTRLIDRDTLTNKGWEPEEFFEVMSDCIDTQAATVIHHASVCKVALLEVVAMVTQAEEQLQKNLEEHSNALSKSIDYIKIHKDFGRHTGKEKTKAVQFTLPRVHEDKVLLVLGRFSKLLSYSVGVMVLSSHSIFCEAISPREANTDHTKEANSLLSTGSGDNSNTVGPGNISYTGSSDGSDKENRPGVNESIQAISVSETLESLKIQVRVVFRVPTVVLEPNVISVYDMISKLLNAVTDLLDKIQPWVGVSEMDEEGERQMEVIVDDIHNSHTRVKQLFKGLKSEFNEFVKSLHPFKPLWQDDLNSCYSAFVKTSPTPQQWLEKIRTLVHLEDEVCSMPSSVGMGPLSLVTHPLKSSLLSLASNWKGQFISSLHKIASERLTKVVQERESMFGTLSAPVPVGDLQNLKEVLELLLRVDHMFHVVDGIYSPVEDMFNVLKSFNFILPRTEAEQVDGLREKWVELTDLATKVQNVLLGSDKLIHEQETSKAVKEFVVETIQFRNAFDTEGPLVPGLIPMEAVSRVGSFLDQSDQLQEKRALLDSVQSLLSLPITPYPELDHTLQELSFLKALYNNYQNFIAFDERFRQTLWSEVDLEESLQQVNGFWDVFLNLPQEQQKWEASHKLRIGIVNYREILPLYVKLHSPEIRNRHWLQVMGVANCNFQLDSRVFKMEHLLEADLHRFSAEIEYIISNACKEQELEKQFLAIEEKWSEQVLKFETHSHTSIPLLSQSYSLSLLEQLDSTQTDLAVMLLSKHIQPLRNDCAQWAGKLGQIGEILQMWLNVQELWLSLQPVFSDKRTARDFPDEAIVFSEITVTWNALMENATTIKSCIQCCTGSDDPILPTLVKLTSDLEHCKKSLSAYLMDKRLTFPRLFYIPDDGLLTLLSNSESVQFVTPYLRSLFGGVSDIVVSGDGPLIINTVLSAEGEELQLAQSVNLSNSSVEKWLCSLQSSCCLTIRQLLLQAMDSDLPSLEEIALYDLTQVACVSLYQQWNKDCEGALSCCRYDRRALPGLRNRFNSTVVSKLSSLLMRTTWKHSEEPVTDLQRYRLETMTVLSLWLRDIIDDLCQRKLREPDDFEWRRFPRLIPHVSADGELDLRLHILDVEIPYSNEYLGCQRLPVFTPRTDAYLVSLAHSLQNHHSSCVSLPDGSNKTEIIKGISYLIGQFVATLDCTSSTQTKAVVNYLTGLAQDGSWGCLCNVHLLAADQLSVLAAMMDTIATAIRQKNKTAILPHSREVRISPTSAVFLTHSLSWTPPTFLSPLLRTFSIPGPDPHLCLRTHCIMLGFKGSRALISRLETLMALINDQLSLSHIHQRVSVYAMCQVLSIASRRVHSVHATPTHPSLPMVTSTSKNDVTKSTPGRSPLRDHSKGQGKVPPSHSTLQPLPVGVIRDHTVVAETISVLLGSRFSKQELPVFHSFLKDVFQDCPDIVPRVTSSSPYHLSSFVQSVTSLHHSTKASLETHANRNGLTCYGNWIDKVEQLYLSLKTNHATIIAGRESTGKTSALKTVMSTMNSRDHTQNGGDYLTVKLHTLYPGVFQSVSDMFGCYDDSGNWRDGLFTSLMRKSMKATQTSTWVSFDGVLSGEWTDHIGQLAISKVISLSNGELLSMNTNTMKLVLETGDISSATPTLITNSGLVFFDTIDLSWRALAAAWLKTRSHHEASCLDKVFEAILDPVVDFVLNKSEYGSTESEVALFETCLSYLSSLLNMYTDTAEVFSDVHVERLFLFSVTWSYGGVLLGDKEKRRFSLLLRQLSNSLPDDDTDYSVFDYYVDESGEWDTWQTKLPESRCQGVDLFGGMFVDTATTIRIETLLELAMVSRKHTLLVGPPLAGKTVTLRHFLSSRALNFSKSESTKNVILNSCSTATDIHQFMQVHLKHRQGYAYGPPANHCLHLMIEDLHVIESDSSTAQEYLRSVVDGRGMYNLVKKNQWNSIEDVLIYCTLTSNKGSAMLNTRLKSHFSVIPVETLSDEDLADIVPILIKCLSPSSDGEYSGNCLSAEVLSHLSSASLELFIKVKDSLRASSTPGRHHYMFSLQHLASALQSIVFCPDCDDTRKLAKLWTYEMNRAFGSPICRHGDIQWLSRTVDQIANNSLCPAPNQPEEACPLYSSIFPNVQSTKDVTKPTTSLSFMPDVMLRPLQLWCDIEDSVHHYVTRYGEEISSTGLGTFEENVNNIMILERLHRALRHARGNCVLVGSLGLPLQSLSVLALYIAGYSVQTLPSEEDMDYRLFTDAMRGVFRMAGLEGKQVGLVLKECHLQVPGVLGLLNSLISSFELPTLFSSEETDGLYHALLPTIKRDFPSEQIDPEQYFAARICQNLRLVICVTPNHLLLSKESRCYPGIFHQSHLIWIPEWTPSSIDNSIGYFLDTSPLASCLPMDDHKDLIQDVLSKIHSFTLAQNGTMIQAGICPLDDNRQPGQTGITGLTPHDYLVERMSAIRSGVTNRLDIPWAGPLLLKGFMECLCRMYREKCTNLMEERKSLKNALHTLDLVSELVTEMKSTLASLKDQLHAASTRAFSLRQQLTAKSCQLERAKALCGQGGVVLSAMRMVSEQKRLMSENEENDFELLAAFYDRLPRKRSRIDAMIEKAKAQLLEAENEERTTKEVMLKTKEKAHYWQNRIDRNTIDQIKNLPNPPALVGVVMELMLSLFRRYGIESSHAHTGNEPTSPAVTRRKVSSYTANTKMEREQWIQLQLAIGDSQRFLDLVNSLKWENGLHKDAINLIESKLATSRNSKLDDVSSLPSTAESISSSGGGSQSGGLITVSMAKYAAESAGCMCGFAVAIVEYQYSFEPYRLAHLKADKLRKQLQALEQEESLDLTVHQSRSVDHRNNLSDVEEEEEEEGSITEEDVRVLGTELQDLQKKFDSSMMEKHNLTSMCEDLTLKLKLAKSLLEGLKPCQEMWLSKSQALPSELTLLIDCIVSSAMLVYGGSLQNNQRSYLFNAVSSLCELKDGSSPSTLTYDNLPSFLLTEAELHHLSMESLPIDEHCLFNTCLINCDHTPYWPLIIDPLVMVEQWMRNRPTIRDKPPRIIQHKDPKKDEVLTQCLIEGMSLVLVDVNTAALERDEVLMELLQNKSAILRGKIPFKIKINGSEVDCNRQFRLFLVTSDDPLSTVPPHVASICTPVMFRPLCIGVESMLLEEFLSIHNQKTFTERQQIKQNIYKLIRQQTSLEQQLLEELSIPEGSTLELEQKIINKLLGVYKSYEFTEENLNQATHALAEMAYHSLSTLSSLSKRASVISECVFLMSTQSPVYKTNYGYISEVFKTFVKQAGSLIQTDDILSKLTRFGTLHFERGYLESDRELFLILTAIQIKMSQGNMTMKEYDFLLVPSIGTSFVIRGLFNQPTTDNVPHVNFGKKPFDWMSEKQWQLLLMLASNFEWVHSLLLSMGKDSKEMVWRTLSEGTTPETVSLIDAIGRNKLTLSHQLLIQCVFRPERISQFMLVFAAVVLNQKPLVPKLYEFQGVLNATLPGHTPLIVYDKNPSILEFKLQHYAQKAQANLRVIKMFGSEEHSTIADILKNIQEMLVEDKCRWVLLHDIHLSEFLMSGLTELVKSVRQECCHEDKKPGKLWLSLNKESLKYISKQLLQQCLRVAIDMPKSPISFLTQTLLTCGQLGIINQSPRSEWLPLIHSMAMSHVILTNRRGVCWWAVGREYNWSQTLLLDMLMYVSREFASSDAATPGVGGFKPVSWSGIRYMHTEVIYGSMVTCSPDMVLLNALADHWLHPGGPRKEPGLYHTSSTFFTPNTRPNTLIQSLETATPPLVPTSELYSIHFTSEMELGNAKFMLNSLVSTNKEIKKSKSHKRVIATVPGIRVESNVSNVQRQSIKPVALLINPAPVRTMDKLPSTISCPYNLLDYHLDSVSTSVISMAVHDTVVAQQVKMQLLMTVNKLVETFPTGWKKDVLLDRLSKHGFEMPFTLFLTNETERLNNCLTAITTDLQHLQTALQSSTNRYLFSFIDLPQTALSLISLRVPDSWSQLVGVSSPPSTVWSLQEWLNDLAQRYVFIDKVLSWGMERTPTYWLGAFFNPKQLLSSVFQSNICSSADQMLLIADLTTRDKDHIRDPSQEGIFMYGIYLWGTHFEKSTSLDVSDTPPKSVNPSALPIVHLTLRSTSTYTVSTVTMETKPPYTYHAPCYITRNHRDQDPLFHVKIVSNDMGTTKWTLKNLFCTLRPF